MSLKKEKQNILKAFLHLIKPVSDYLSGEMQRFYFSWCSLITFTRLSPEVLEDRSSIWAVNHGLRQRIFKSACVFPRGQEGEQMLCSFNHACRRLPPLCGTQTSSLCSQDEHICANLSQVLEDPLHRCHECDNKLPATSHPSLIPHWGGSVCLSFLSCLHVILTPAAPFLSTSARFCA